MSNKCLFGIHKQNMQTVIIKLRDIGLEEEKEIRKKELSIYKVKEIENSTKDISNAFNQLVGDLNDFEQYKISQNEIESKISTSIKSYFTQVKTYLDSMPHSLKKELS